MSILIKANGIYKTFKTEGENQLELFKNLNVEIEKSKITVIVGASGAGKSTLLHILSGLDKPDKGEVFFDGKNIYELNETQIAKLRNQKLGFVFQFHHLLEEFTALENVFIPSMIAGIPREDAVNKATELLERFGLGKRVNHKPAELSGGEQQRVAIARALINQPEIVFADEPTGNLDSENSESIHQLIKQLKEEFNSTILLVTHNPELVKLGDEVLKIKDGKIA